MIEALDVGDFEEVKTIMESSDIDLNNVKDSYGRNVIHKAALLKETKTLELVLQVCKRVNAKNEDGDTPIIYACRKNRLGNVALLLRNGASPNVKSGVVGGYAPLHIAAEKNNIELVKLLLDNGADRGLENDSKKKAVALAKCAEIKKLLLRPRD